MATLKINKVKAGTVDISLSTLVTNSSFRI